MLCTIYDVCFSVVGAKQVYEQQQSAERTRSAAERFCSAGLLPAPRMSFLPLLRQPR